ncbi:hypothetical protein CTheo_1640 [Ceratobasidium theobromae]|uniref:Uncharacterized protein n=1 Tax=Ceratobasidium theobromae TaxID=1582974 RepID=A0A5N5QUX5_9AGAM|nr:hypothetical protein CTheo_1640 [Ceratobasidium theobromae]
MLRRVASAMARDTGVMDDSASDSQADWRRGESGKRASAERTWGDDSDHVDIRCRENIWADTRDMIPVPSSSQKPLKPILKRTPSGVAKTVTFSATNSQVFFADDWDRSAVEVVSKLSYSDVLELKQLSLESLPSDRHASMGLSPLLSHVPLTLCPLAAEGPKKQPTSPLVVPDLSILASPASPPPPALSPASSDAESSVSIGSVSPHTSESSPESTPPQSNVKLTVPVPVRRPLMMNFTPLLPEPGSELPSPVLSASSSLSESSTDTGKTLSHFGSPQTPQTPMTPRTPHTPNCLSPIPASPISPTFGAPQMQTPDKGWSLAQPSALAGASGGVGMARAKSAGTASPVSPVSPASDTPTVSAASPLVRPVPRRAYVRRASIDSAPDDPVARTKASRGFDEARTKRLAIAATAWVDGALPDKPALPVATRPHRSHSVNDALPQPPKYVNPYSQIRETDSQLTPRLGSARLAQPTRVPPPHFGEDSLGLAMRPPTMNRPAPVHRASVHGYPYGANRPPSPTPKAFSRGYPSPLSPNTPLPQPQAQLQARSKPLTAKDANLGRPANGYALPDGPLSASPLDRKPRSTDVSTPSPKLAPMARPKNSRVGR